MSKAYRPSSTASAFVKGQFDMIFAQFLIHTIVKDSCHLQSFEKRLQAHNKPCMQSSNSERTLTKQEETTSSLAACYASSR